MNTDLMFSSAKEDWETPTELFMRYHKLHNFTLDVAADDKNHKLSNYFTVEDDGLSQIWTGRCWMNPPYGKYTTPKWIKKAHDSVLVEGTADMVCCLIPSRTDTKWFHKYIWHPEFQAPRHGVDVQFLEGRVHFLIDGEKQDAAPFPSMVVIFTNEYTE